MDNATEAGVEDSAAQGPNDGVFELGFVLAGAISAGAYTAGVIDFFTEALDEYEYARTHGVTKAGEPWDGPRHAVKVPVLAGASAGGMTAAISALQWFRETEHVWPGQPVPEPAKNRLYASWVDEIGLEKFLETRDLDTPERRSNGVQSLMCCDVLDDIVARAFDNPGPVVRRPWVGGRKSDALAVFLTVSNLSGVPYSFKLFGSSSDDERYGMLYHADDARFLVSDRAASLPGYISLDTTALNAPDWGTFRSAALATGAFPGGLAARAITRDLGAYRDMQRVGYYVDREQRIPIQPDACVAAGTSYKFVSVDGGMIDNEPFELARRYIAIDPNRRNSQDGNKADRAVILVDPFPNQDTLPKQNIKTRLSSVIGRTISALKNQARFKPEELELAQDETVFSRFAIAPTRETGGSDVQRKKYPIACGILEGFGGFLHQSFRRHDYLLGRRNAQAFIRWHMALPETNSLFAGFGAPGSPERERWYVRDVPSACQTSVGPGEDRDYGLAKVAPQKGAEETKMALPIIPLVPRLLTPVEITREDFPKPELLAIDDLERPIRKRIGAVFNGIFDEDVAPMFGTGLLAWIARLPARLLTQEYGARIAKRYLEQAREEARDAFK